MHFRRSYPALAALCLIVAQPPAVPLSDGPPMMLAYQLRVGETLRYKLTANIKGSIPLFDSPTPVDVEAVITVVYLATPKTLLADGTSDVSCEVESADVEVQKIPFPVPLEDAQKILNQTVTLSRRGEVKKTAGDPGSLKLSIPGVDPKRLYALIFPVVFESRPISAGETWTYKSELLGGQGSKPVFTATLMPAGDPASPIARLREKFSMAVDQKVDAEKNPVSGNKKPYRWRKGLIRGSGALEFDREAGHFTKSVVNLKANILDDLVGKPLSKEDPKRINSRVDATVTVELQRAAPAAGSSAKKAAP